MDNVTEDEAKEIAEEVYHILKERGVVFLPKMVLKEEKYLRDLRITKRWIIKTLADEIVDKIE